MSRVLDVDSSLEMREEVSRSCAWYKSSVRTPFHDLSSNLVNMFSMSYKISKVALLQRLDSCKLKNEDRGL